MQIIVEDGYVSSYALEGSLVDGIEVPDPLDTDHFEAHFQSYRLKDGALEYDEEQNAKIEQEALREQLRKQREAECFSVINRGWLWYDTLSDTQVSELRDWYRGWLDVTDTLTVPAEPSWINTTI